jgi:hypothetical protein
MTTSPYKVLMMVIIVLVVSKTANAQATYDGCVAPGGVPVASVRNDAINDVAMASYVATYTGPAPVIFYNTGVLSWLAPQTRLFFYAHECAHHVLGHVLSGLRLGQEQEADCWGIRTLVSAGLLSDADIDIVQKDIVAFGRGDWTHLPGPQRAINLRRCLQ